MYIQLTKLSAPTVAARLGGAKRSGKGWAARCPAHDDYNPSLSLTDSGAGRLLWHCHAGCSQEDVQNALIARDLISAPSTRESDDTPFQTTYTYEKADGSKWCDVVRSDLSDGSKGIRPRRPDGIPRLPSGPRPLYRLPKLLGDDRAILVIEGEKAAEAAAAMEELSAYSPTTSISGSGAASSSDWSPMEGRDVVIWPDNDEPGHKYAMCVAELSYEAGASSVKIVDVADALFARSWDLADPVPVGIDIIGMIAEASPADRQPAKGKQPKKRPAELPDIATRKITEYKVADLYRQRHQDDTIFDAHLGKWVHFDPAKGWRDTGAFSAAKRLVEEIVSANSVTSTRSLESLGFTRRFMQIAAEDGLRKEVTWDQTPCIAGLKGGRVLDFATGRVRPMTPNDYIRQCLPCEPARSCRWWEDLVIDWMDQDDEMASFLQTLMGYAMLGDPTEQQFWVFLGAGGEGKTMFLHGIQNAVGPYATSTPPKTFAGTTFDADHPTQIARLAGRRVVYAAESPRHGAWRTTLLKEFTGGDLMTARHMRQDPFEFRPVGTLILVANELRPLHEVTDAIKRRLRIVRWLVKPKHPDHTLGRQISERRAEVLRWLMTGAQNYRAYGLKQPAKVREWTDGYVAEQDVVQRFVEERTEKGSHAKDRIVAKELYAAYCSWSENEGLKPIGRNTFHERAQTHYRRPRLGGRYVYLSIRWKSRDD